MERMATERRRRGVTAEEARVWRNAMSGAKPFPHSVPVEGETAIGEASLAAPLPADEPARPLRPRQSPPPGKTAPPLDHGRSPGLDKNTAERLRKGAMAIDASLDLHGLTQEVAHAALIRFVNGSAQLGRRCLLVVTGKGNREGAGILRTQVPRWLNEPALRSLILAFAYAQPKHGGEGALYVLLKRQR
jgi:DNA-nicking Smr family endonuclease